MPPDPPDPRVRMVASILNRRQPKRHSYGKAPKESFSDCFITNPEDSGKTIDLWGEQAYQA